jgi:5-aminolevulinate synthase
VVGGYIAGSAKLCDFIRSFASGFIFTTSPPPHVAAGALAAVRHLKESNIERELHRDRVAKVRTRLGQVGILHLPNPSHIVPVIVGDAFRYRPPDRRAVGAVVALCAGKGGGLT